MAAHEGYFGHQGNRILKNSCFRLKKQNLFSDIFRLLNTNEKIPSHAAGQFE